MMWALTTHLNILGNRVVAMALEEIADNVERIAQDALSPILDRNFENPLERKLLHLISLTTSVADNAFDAFLKKDARAGGSASLGAGDAIGEFSEVAETISRIDDKELAIPLRILLRYLTQVIKHYKTIADIMVNRSLEGSNEISSIVTKEE